MSESDVSESFDLTGDLPRTLTVLEASAGTGKTYALAAIALRYVAEEGLSASQLCIVSFTEAATAELRGRVRSRLAQAADHLDAAGGPVPADPVLTALATVDDAERSRRAQRLRRAVADFDAATISTIHGFCHRVLAVGGAGAQESITADDGDVAELVTDAYLARYGDGTPAPIELAKLVAVVEARLGLPDAEMARPVDEARQKFPARSALVDEVADLADLLVAQVRRRRRDERRRTFDTLLFDARALLTGPTEQGEGVVPALRSRFGLVLIDEFQDTDQVQWDVFRTAFLERRPRAPEPVPVVLVGDPKQSIYRFRGAELSAYLEARRFALEHGGRLATLSVNRRSDEPLLDGLARIFDGYHFGDPEVVFTPVAAAEDHRSCPLELGDAAAVQLRCVPEDVGSVPEARARVLPDLVAEVVGLLDTAWITDGGGRRRLRASDIGVLVRSNVDAGLYADALAAAGVPAARSSSDSVLDSEAAEQWRILLTALERPTSPSRARAALVGWFIGKTAAEVADLTDDGLGEEMDRLRAWASCLRDAGLPVLLAEVRRGGLSRRLLSSVGGERDLTDVDHVAELLQHVTGGRPIAASALLAALRALGAPSPFGHPDDAVAAELLSRRIDRDDDTVKVLTIHASKGLEFPVVLCPTLWTAPGGAIGVRHGWDGERRLLDTHATLADVEGDAAKGKDAKAFKAVKHLDDAERDGEARRLLYVAMTRAKHRLVVWWYRPAKGTPPLAELMTQACGGDGTIELDALVASAGGCISRVDVPSSRPVPARPTVDDGERADLEVAVARRRLDRTWRIWSFTAVQGAASQQAAVLEVAEQQADPPPIGGNDEPSDADDSLEAVEPPMAGSAWRDIAGGKAFGTLVHAVLERTDFAAAALHDELRARCADALQHRHLPVTPALVADGLLEAVHAPLGGPVGNLRLSDLARNDRLDELGFDLPLARFDARAIGAVLAEHLATDDVFRPWAERAADGGLQVEVAGWLNGSIDLVARVPATSRYWLADYKTNRLADGSDYGTTELVEAMEHAGYPLQATLYLVALHRYLRWRLPAYDPDHHLLGAAYLFLRGMDPGRPATDTRGVLWWRPPTAALDALDALFRIGARS